MEGMNTPTLAEIVGNITKIRQLILDIDKID